MKEPGFSSVPLLILDDASIGKGDQAGCAFHDHRIMGGEDEGHLLNPVEVPHHLEQLYTCFRIEVGGWLVRENQVRL